MSKSLEKLFRKIVLPHKASYQLSTEHAYIGCGMAPGLSITNEGRIYFYDERFKNICIIMGLNR